MFFSRALDQLTERVGLYVAELLNHDGRSNSVPELERYPFRDFVWRRASEDTFH